MISQERLDDLEQHVDQFADRRTVAELLAEVRRLRMQVRLLEASLLGIPNVEPSITVTSIKAQALREAAEEIRHHVLGHRRSESYAEWLELRAATLTREGGR